MANLNLHESFPLNAVSLTTWGIGTLPIFGFYLGSTLPFTSVNILLSCSGATNRTISVSFGLYSLNGSTLSLANSASGSMTAGGSSTSWVSLVTSAAQNLSAGNWFTALVYTTAGDSRWSIAARQILIPSGASAGAGTHTPNWNTIRPGGVAADFAFGIRATSTGGIPATIHSSDVAQNVLTVIKQPYVIISG